ESCGFGFVLHRRLVEAGAQSFLITPIALNGQRKTDKLEARALCVRLSAGSMATKTNWLPFASPARPSNARARSRVAANSCRRKFAAWPIAGTGRWPTAAQKMKVKLA